MNKYFNNDTRLKQQCLFFSELGKHRWFAKGIWTVNDNLFQNNFEVDWYCTQVSLTSILILSSGHPKQHKLAFKRILSQDQKNYSSIFSEIAVYSKMMLMHKRSTESIFSKLKEQTAKVSAEDFTITTAIQIYHSKKGNSIATLPFEGWIMQAVIEWKKDGSKMYINQELSDMAMYVRCHKNGPENNYLNFAYTCLPKKDTVGQLTCAVVTKDTSLDNQSQVRAKRSLRLADYWKNIRAEMGQLWDNWKVLVPNVASCIASVVGCDICFNFLGTYNFSIRPRACLKRCKMDTLSSCLSLVIKSMTNTLKEHYRKTQL